MQYVKTMDKILEGIQSHLQNMSQSFWPSVKELSNHQASLLLQGDGERKKLFPKYKWFISDTYWKPLLITNNNLRSVICKSNVLASYDGSERIEGVSFNSFTNIRHGVRLDLWYYGENEKALLAHVHSCLQHACNVIPACTFYILVHFPEPFDYGYVHGELSCFLGERYQLPPFEPFSNNRLQTIAWSA